MKTTIYPIIVVCLIFLLVCPISSAIIKDFTCSSTDGYLTKTNTTYSDANTASAADSKDTGSDQLRVGQVHSGDWTIFRTFLSADTSALPDWALIQRAWLSFYVTSTTGEYVLVARSTVGGLIPHIPLQLADFDIYGYDSSNLLIANTGTGWKNIIIYDENFSTEGIYISNSSQTKMALFCSNDDLGIATDSGYVGFESADASYKPYITVQYNQPPNASVLSGRATGYYQDTYSLTVSGTDPDEDNVNFRIDWGDGATSVCPAVGLYIPSGQNRTATHKYGGTGDYTISVKTYDNSGGSNDHSGSTIKTVKMESKPAGGGNPPSTKDPNEQITRLAAKYVDRKDGDKDLAVWWYLSDAALLQSDLMINLSVDNQEGNSLIDIIYAKDHDTEETAYVIEDWNKQYPGDSTWGFTLHATFVNPNEPVNCSKGDNTASLLFWMGFPIWFDLWMTLLIISVIIIIITIILLIYYRKRILWMWYLGKEDITEEHTERLMDDLANKPDRDKTKMERRLQEKLHRVKAGESVMPGWAKAMGGVWQAPSYAKRAASYTHAKALIHGKQGIKRMPYAKKLFPDMFKGDKTKQLVEEHGIKETIKHKAFIRKKGKQIAETKKIVKEAKKTASIKPVYEYKPSKGKQLRPSEIPTIVKPVKKPKVSKRYEMAHKIGDMLFGKKFKNIKPEEIATLPVVVTSDLAFPKTPQEVSRDFNTAAAKSVRKLEIAGASEGTINAERERWEKKNKKRYDEKSKDVKRQQKLQESIEKIKEYTSTKPISGTPTRGGKPARREQLDNEVLDVLKGVYSRKDLDRFYKLRKKYPGGRIPDEVTYGIAAESILRMNNEIGGIYNKYGKHAYADSPEQVAKAKAKQKERAEKQTRKAKEREQKRIAKERRAKRKTERPPKERPETRGMRVQQYLNEFDKVQVNTRLRNEGSAYDPEYTDDTDEGRNLIDRINEFERERKISKRERLRNRYANMSKKPAAGQEKTYRRKPKKRKRKIIRYKRKKPVKRRKIHHRNHATVKRKMKILPIKRKKKKSNLSWI